MQSGTLSIEPAPLADVENAEPVGNDEIDSVPASEVAALLAQRDERTAELEAAISELQAAGAPARNVDVEGFGEGSAEFGDTISRLELRLEEQEQSFRHVLAMLIEWLEEDAPREAA